MPCGQLDKRRGGHRCAACRKRHQRCDGQQPCLNCRQRGLDCIFFREAAGLQIVQLTPGLAPRNALTHESWRYITLWFNAAGVLPQAAVLRSDMVVALCHANQDVNSALSIAGQAYASRSGCDLSLALGQDRVTRLLALQKALSSRQMRQAITKSAGAHLLCALLLAVADLLLDDTVTCWRSGMAEICGFISRITKDVPHLSPLDMELIRFSQLNDILGSLALAERPLGPDFSAGILNSNHPSPVNADAPSRTRLTEGYNQALSIMWQWSVLQHRLLLWIRSASFHRGEGLSCEQRIQGTALVDEALRLQLTILRILLPLTDPSDTTCRFLGPYYRWILLGMSQLLQSQAFGQLGCALPIMPPDCLHLQALAALNDVEEMTIHAVLDAAFFLPLLDTIGGALEATEDRRRLLRFLGNIEACGFGVAKGYREDILAR